MSFTSGTFDQLVANYTLRPIWDGDDSTRHVDGATRAGEVLMDAAFIAGGVLAGMQLARGYAKVGPLAQVMLGLPERLPLTTVGKVVSGISVLVAAAGVADLIRGTGAASEGPSPTASTPRATPPRDPAWEHPADGPRFQLLPNAPLTPPPAPLLPPAPSSPPPVQLLPLAPPMQPAATYV